MKCPHCHSDNDKVVDSRPSESGHEVRRRRECLACGYRFTTYERIENKTLFVKKRDGRREPFDREKLIHNIFKACHKRRLDRNDIEKLIDRVEQTLRASKIDEIPTAMIGERVLEELGQLDEVAYIRFASVYKAFDSVESFMNELKDLRKKKKGRISDE
ncbi:MAG: transcriptional regulator NrdR [Eubacteriales bacterium]|nr:transcriptional regulator NrdR [Eubacteriales bacterium]